MTTTSGEPDHRTRILATLAADPLASDPSAVPPPVESSGPADLEPVDQAPGFEEVDVDDASAETTLADPAVQEA